MNLNTEIFLIVALVVILHILVFLYVSRKPKKSIKNRHVVITGGSSGIGLWSAIHCIKLGAHVTIIARNQKFLDKAKELILKHRNDDSQRVLTRSLDISKSYEDVEKTLLEIEEEMGDIDMLINCAGFAICGVLEEMSIDEAKMLMDINYYGTLYPTRYVLPKMKKRRSGIIVITASQAALFGIYGYGLYGATKFALRGLAETIRMETAHLGIIVTLALPCDTDTPGFKREEETKPKETKIISASGGLVDPEKIAKRLVDDALRGTFFSVYGFESWLLSNLCVGMSPWSGIGLNIFQLIFLGPLRMIGLVISWYFYRVVKDCQKEKDNKTKVE